MILCRKGENNIIKLHPKWSKLSIQPVHITSLEQPYRNPEPGHDIEIAPKTKDGSDQLA